MTDGLDGAVVPIRDSDPLAFVLNLHNAVGHTPKNLMEDALRQIAAEGVERVLEGMRSPHSRVSSYCALLFSEMSPRYSEKLVPAAMALLDNAYPSAKEDIVEGLCPHSSTMADQEIAVVIELLEDADERVARKAIIFVGSLSPDRAKSATNLLGDAEKRQVHTLAADFAAEAADVSKELLNCVGKPSSLKKMYLLVRAVREVAKSEKNLVPQDTKDNSYIYFHQFLDLKLRRIRRYRTHAKNG